MLYWTIYCSAGCKKQLGKQHSKSEWWANIVLGMVGGGHRLPRYLLALFV